MEGCASHSAWKWRSASIVGVLWILTLTAVGSLYASLRDSRLQPDWIGQKKIDRPAPYLIRIREEASRTKTDWRIKADLIARSDSIHNDYTSSGVFLYTRSDSLAREAIPGRTAWATLKLQGIKNKSNSSFDHERYCRQNKITHQCFLSDRSNLHWIDPSGRDIQTVLHHIRHRMRTILSDRLNDSVKTDWLPRY